MAYVIAPDGTPGEVPDEQLQAALAAGYKPRQPDAQDLARKQAGEQTGRAFVEGAARGATMGLSDPFLKGFGVKSEELKARKEENPVAAGVGELTGAVGTSLATGGGASALVGGGLKGAAFEGGLYGMGSLISESSLENKPVTVDRLAAGFAGGALAGGAVHGGMSLIGKGASAIVSKVGGGTLKGALEEAAYRVEERSLAEGNKPLLKKLERRGGSLRDVVEYARKEGIPVAFNEESQAAIEAALKKTGDKTAALIAPLDNVVPLTRDVERAALVDSLRQSLEGRFKGDIAAEREVANFVSQELEPLLGRTDLKWPELYKLQSRLRGKVEVGALSIKKEVYDAGRKTIRDAIFDTAEKSGVPQGMLKGFQKDYATGAFLKEAIDNRVASLRSIGGVPGVGLMDAVRGGGLGSSVGFAVAGPVGAPVGALVGAYANKVTRERGGALAAGALRTLADSAALKGAGKALQQRFSTIMSVAPEVLGAYRFPLAQAAAISADALLEEHLKLASGPYGQDYLSKMALPVESPEEVEAAGRHIAILDAIHDAGQSDDKEIDALFGSAPGRKGSVSTMSLKQFNEVKARLSAALTDPTVAFENVPADMRAAAPSTTTEAMAASLNALRYLDSKMPRDPYAGMPESVRPQWQPSAADLDRFNRVKEAIESPARVLKNMANGYIAPEQVEALKAVYPALYADLQQKIGERLAMWQKPLTYQQKLAFSAILGPKALAMSPQQVQILQQSMQTAAGGPGGPNKPSVPKSDGRMDVNEEQIQTESQKLEART